MSQILYWVDSPAAKMHAAGEDNTLKTLPFSSDESLNLCLFMQIDFSCSIDYEVTGTSGELERRTYEARTLLREP